MHQCPHVSPMATPLFVAFSWLHRNVLLQPKWFSMALSRKAAEAYVWRWKVKPKILFIKTQRADANIFANCSIAYNLAYLMTTWLVGDFKIVALIMFRIQSSIAYQRSNDARVWGLWGACIPFNEMHLPLMLISPVSSCPAERSVNALRVGRLQWEV